MTPDLPPATAEPAPVAVAAPPDAWRVDAWASASELDGGREPWAAAGVALGRRLSADAGVSLSLEATERFGQADVYVEAAGERRLGPWSVSAAVGGAPAADHRAELSVAAGTWRDAAATPAGALRAGVDARWSRYAAGEVWTLLPGVTLEGPRGALDARWVQVQDETGAWRDGWTVRGAHDLADWLRLDASLAHAPETSEGRTVDVRSLGVGARFALGETAHVRVGWLAEDRGPGGDRRELSVWVMRRF